VLVTYFQNSKLFVLFLLVFSKSYSFSSYLVFVSRLSSIPPCTQQPSSHQAATEIKKNKTKHFRIFPSFTNDLVCLPFEQ